MKLAPEEITTMQAVAAAATPGSWQYNPFDATIFSIGQPFATGVPPGEQPRPEDYDVSVLPVFNIHEEQEELANLENDAEFCCAARAFVPKAIEALLFTEASTQEALLILDDVASTPGASDALLLAAIDAVVQKLRPVPAPVHDAAALAKACARLEAVPMVVAGRPSNPTKCSPLSCSGCAACYKSGEPAPTTPTELPMLEGGEGV